VLFERCLDGGQDICRRGNDGVAGNGQLYVGVGALHHYLGRDDVGMLVIHRLERSKINIGARVSGNDVEPCM
jgi:hypothetical protein